MTAPQVVRVCMAPVIHILALGTSIQLFSLSVAIVVTNLWNLTPQAATSPYMETPTEGRFAIVGKNCFEVYSFFILPKVTSNGQPLLALHTEGNGMC